MPYCKDLIIDVGMHDGSDTAYYLHRGYRVVAIEADPVLVEAGRRKFAAEIAAGRLTIVDKGVGNTEGKLTFWVNEKLSEWSSFDKEVAMRDGTKAHPVEVECIRFSRVIRDYGVPYYLKMDIEGNDLYCLRDLDPSTAPPYLSIEAHSMDYCILLGALGYNRFKLINQEFHNSPIAQDGRQELPLLDAHRRAISRADWILRANGRLGEAQPLGRALSKVGMGWLPRALTAGVKSLRNPKLPPGETWKFDFGSSGPFGEETWGEWQDMESVVYDWTHFKRKKINRGGLAMRGWFDFHARHSSHDPK